MINIILISDCVQSVQSIVPHCSLHTIPRGGCTGQTKYLNFSIFPLRSSPCPVPSHQRSPGRPGTPGRSSRGRTCPGCTGVRDPSVCSVPGPGLTCTTSSLIFLGSPAPSHLPKSLEKKYCNRLLFISSNHKNIPIPYYSSIAVYLRLLG